MKNSGISLFKHPLALGFETFEETLDQVCKQSQGYPPYNLERLVDGILRLSIAVAGFRHEELMVQVERNRLLIRGKRREESTRLYLYRGIATRQFQKAFLLADGMKVRQAILEDGLIHIDLELPSRSHGTRTIPIVNKSKSAISLLKKEEREE